METLTTGKGIVVEFGSWIGQSSRCLGAGMNTTGHRGHLFSYDLYKDPINNDKLMGSRYEKDFKDFKDFQDSKDFQFIWWETGTQFNRKTINWLESRYLNINKA